MNLLAIMISAHDIFYGGKMDLWEIQDHCHCVELSTKNANGEKPSIRKSLEETSRLVRKSISSFVFFTSTYPNAEQSFNLHKLKNTGWREQLK